MSATIKTSLTPIKGDFRRESERIMSLGAELVANFSANNPHCTPFVQQMGFNAWDALYQDKTKFDSLKKDHPDEEDRLLLETTYLKSHLKQVEFRLKEALGAKKTEEARQFVKVIQALNKDIEERFEKLKAAGKLEETESVAKMLMDLMTGFCFKTSLIPIKGDWKTEIDRIKSLEAEIRDHCAANKPEYLPVVKSIIVPLLDQLYRDDTKFGPPAAGSVNFARLVIEKIYLLRYKLNVEGRLKMAQAAKQADYARELEKLVQSVSKDIEEREEAVKATGMTILADALYKSVSGGREPTSY